MLLKGKLFLTVLKNRQRHRAARVSIWRVSRCAECCLYKQQRARGVEMRLGIRNAMRSIEALRLLIIGSVTFGVCAKWMRLAK